MVSAVAASDTEASSEPGVEDVLRRAVASAGGADREGQVQMATAVAHAMDSGRHLLVQAGTGTGKSWAYLVPAIVAAVRHQTRIVVATSTLALQSQLVARDLPALAEAAQLELGRSPTWALLKGRHNYVCRHRLLAPPGQEAADPLWSAAAASTLETQVAAVREWAEETTTGDRDDLDVTVSDRAWRAVSVTARECLGASRCPQGVECFSESARRSAREADIVVTNHALLALDAADRPGTLPEHDVVIVDEGHDFADRVTGALSVELSPTAVAGAAAAVRSGGADPGELDAAAVVLGRALDDAPLGRLSGGVTGQLGDALVLVATAARSAARALAPESSSDVDPRAQAARAALADVADVAARLSGDSVGVPDASADRPGEAPVAAHGGGDVVWVAEHESRGRSLHGAPLSVARLLAQRVFAERTVIMTSATLAPGGRFDAVARRVGLVRQTDEPMVVQPVEAAGPDRTGGRTDAPGQRVAPAWDALDAGSPFDYGRQGILYIAAHLPPPGRDQHPDVVHDELARLVEASGGATLGLFSSRRAAVAAADTLRKRIDVPILCQGDDTVAVLIRRFASDPATCLFGTLGLWQGVDVPGPACRLVVIDRIPFPRPDDPLTSARSEAVDRAGGSGFAAVSIAHAATLLSQGAGRLIRRTDDRGVVAILDSRISTKRYGAALIAAMPPMWRTTNLDTALQALARLARSSPS